MSIPRKKKPVDIQDPEAIAELGCVPMSSEAKSQMSLNPYDQLFICRLLNLRDDAVKEAMSTALAEVIDARDRHMFETLDKQTKLIEGVAVDVSEIKNRLNKDEKQLAAITKQVKSIHKRLVAVEGKVKVFECKK
jgi:uncharacterized coiled-coil protein SlyX